MNEHQTPSTGMPTNSEALPDDLIEAHLNLAYSSSGLNGGMCGVQWDNIVARRFYALGVAVGAALIPAPRAAMGAQPAQGGDKP